MAVCAKITYRSVIPYYVNRAKGGHVSPCVTLKDIQKPYDFEAIGLT